MVAELPGPLCLNYIPANMQQKAVQIEDHDLLPRNFWMNGTGSGSSIEPIPARVAAPSWPAWLPRPSPAEPTPLAAVD
ncbi:hypothetical protein R1flu_021560 [Riccia fluitans]|uniref:Uncharacterized protein n=1 Tax=Riccia fluitans TaxID=41844 RepID=A0ABD1ZPQ5_9MARC